MTREILDFFRIQRSIFGVCPRSGEIFRLSDCKVFPRTKPKKDGKDVLDQKEQRLEGLEEKIDQRKKELQERGQQRGRRLAQAAIRKIDPVFTPRRLNPDDAKVIFPPIDYLVFKGMNEEGAISRILLLDREARSADHRRLQRSIETVVDKGKRLSAVNFARHGIKKSDTQVVRIFLKELIKVVGASLSVRKPIAF